MNKYHNREVTSVVGHFDSQKEYNRYRELDLLQRAGKIKNLKRQIRYSILPAQKRSDGRRERGIEYMRILSTKKQHRTAGRQWSKTSRGK